MSVLALVTKAEEVEPVIRWAAQFAVARETSLTVMCWAHAPTDQFPLLADETETSAVDHLVAQAEQLVEVDASEEGSGVFPLPEEMVQIMRLMGPDADLATLEQVRLQDAELLVAAAADQGDESFATYAGNPLLRQSPCNTVILYWAPNRSMVPKRVFVATEESPHDRALVSLGGHMAENCRSKVTLARLEQDTGEEAVEIGRRELRQLMRDAGVKPHDRIRRFVMESLDYRQLGKKFKREDLVLVRPDNPTGVRFALDATTHPTIAILKRSPPLRPWSQGRRATDWFPRLHPGDYADLVQNLRRGSKLSADFLIMLGLAAAIAALGLLQDSAAVVIGSMILAPLMIPMVGTGLALVQANPKLARNCFESISVGFLLTVLVSFLLGLVSPDPDLTMQITARCDPNTLDLVVAFCSAAAAAYAMARPSLLGAMAGVAIAVALVPPLCALGISLAYREYMNAYGAGLLFTTNLLAIILGAAATFRMMGVTAARASVHQRRWVYEVIGVMALGAVLLAIPLERALDRRVDEGRPQPVAFPVSRAVARAVSRYVNKMPGVEIMFMARPSVESNIDVGIYLAAERRLPLTVADDITKIVRDAQDNPEAVVRVVCVRDAWGGDPHDLSPQEKIEFRRE